jgi:hypothetical protein
MFGAALVVCFAAFVMAVPSAVARPAQLPFVVQLSYSEAPGQQGPDRALEAFARRTDSLKFHTAFKHQRITVPGRYDPKVTDTDIRGPRAKHPWRPNRRQRGSRLISLVHRSLHQRGFARVTVRASNDRAGTFITRPVINLASPDCTLDPPLYPIDCTVPVG